MTFVIGRGKEVVGHAVHGENRVRFQSRVVVPKSERGNLCIEINVRAAMGINERASMRFLEINQETSKGARYGQENHVVGGARIIGRHLIYTRNLMFLSKCLPVPKMLEC